MDLSLARIEEAARVVDPAFRNSPQYADVRLSAALGREVVVKVETANPLTTVITVTAKVATAADEAARSTFITAVIEETDPWQLAHLQWTPADPSHDRGGLDD